MGWFDEQIEYRKEQERKLLSDSFRKLELTVTGRSLSKEFSEGTDVNEALEALLAYFGIREKTIPPRLKSLEQKLDYLLSSSDIMYREVTLESGWHKDAMGAMITTLKESGTVITVVRNSAGTYTYRDPVSGRFIKVTPAEEKKISEKAYCFYRPLPLRAIKLKDLFTYMAETLRVWDIAAFACAALAIVLVGMLMPRMNHILMEEVVAYGSNQLLAAVMGFMLFATIGNFMLIMIRSLLLSRIQMKLSVNVEAAAMMRVLSLPPDFFKTYSSGELSQYLTYLNSLCDTLVTSIFSTALTGVFSLVYLTQIFSYARSLVIPALLVTVLTLALSLSANALQAERNKEQMGLAAKERGLTYSLINGIEKIRLSGSEKRVFAKWMDLYSQDAEL